LWEQYVPDAHVLQLFTARHLERVHDLSAWQVSEMAQGRFLLEAADTGPWLRQRRTRRTDRDFAAVLRLT
jgi:hypothetical protein